QGIAMAGGKAVAGQDEPGDQQAGQHGHGPGGQGQRGDPGRLGGQHDRAARYGGQGDPDHAAAVLAADDEHGQDGDDGLAEVDAGQRDLGGVLVGAERAVPDGGDRDGADPGGQDGGGEQEPADTAGGAELGPFGVDGGHLRRPAAAA